MKLSLDMRSVDALRTLAGAIPGAIESIVCSTQRLVSVYQTVSETLGVHESYFYEMVLSVKKAQEISADAVASVPDLLLSTADKIERYVHSHPTCQDDSNLEIISKGKEIRAESTSSENMQLVQHTIFEIETLKDSLDLTDGDPAVAQAGGAYREVKKSVDSTIYEVHHIPPQSIFVDSFESLPAIAMLKHKKWQTN